MAFNKVVVSAFVKPLPRLVDVGGLQPGIAKVVRKTQKLGEEGILHYICIS